MTELEAAYYGSEIRHRDRSANHVRWYALPGDQGWCVTVRYHQGRYFDLRSVPACIDHLRVILGENGPLLEG